MALSDMGIGDYGSVASDLLGGFTSFAAGKAEAKGYTAAAKYARKDATLAGASTALDLLRQQRKSYQVLGAGRADVGASGLALHGSALDVIRDSAQQSSLDRSMIRIQGQMTQNDYAAKASSYDAQAKAAKAKGSGGLFGGILKGITTIAGFIP